MSAHPQGALSPPVRVRERSRPPPGRRPLLLRPWVTPWKTGTSSALAPQPADGGSRQRSLRDVPAVLRRPSRPSPTGFSQGFRFASGRGASEPLLIRNRPVFFPSVVLLSNSDEALHGMSHIHPDSPSRGHRWLPGAVYPVTTGRAVAGVSIGPQGRSLFSPFPPGDRGLRRGRDWFISLPTFLRETGPGGGPTPLPAGHPAALGSCTTVGHPAGVP